MNKNDLRFIKTEKIIKESFKKCVNEAGFDKVTVSMICENGLISRNAFYLHFTDKNDLLDRLFDEFSAALVKKYGKKINEFLVKNDIYSSTKLYADAIVENREDFIFLMKCSRKRMENVIKEIIVEMPSRKMIKDYNEITSNIKVRLNMRYMLSAMVAYTELWLENYDKISYEEAVFGLYKLCEKPTILFNEYFR